MGIQLSETDRAAYGRDGFLVVPDLLAPAEVAALRDRVREYTHGDRARNGIVFQTEPRVQRGELSVAHPGDAIRKIERLVEHDDLFRNLGLHPHIVGIIATLLGPDLKMFRNALLLKPPDVGSQKGWHQDSPYWPIEPMALCSCWFPLDDATLQNGCMVVLPGGHQLGPLPHLRVPDDFVMDPACFAEEDGVACPMKAGSGLFFHSLLPHYTAPNRSDRWRRAIALSYMSSRSRYTGQSEGPVYFPVQGETFPGCVR